MPRELDAVAEALKQGRPVEPVTVRVFLSWFDAQRRGIHVVRDIRDQLQKAGVETDPDFRPAYIETPINFRRLSTTQSGDLNGNSTQEVHGVPSIQHGSSAGNNNSAALANGDPTYSISRLQAANAEVTRIAPDALISSAVTLMLANDFS